MDTGTQAQVVMETVPVGNPGNAGELSGECVADGYGPCRECGAVDYEYNIGKYEVTAGQYTAFLNAVAADDAYGLYSTSMWSTSKGCKIRQTGSWGSYVYIVDADEDDVEDADWLDRPVNTVSWGDAARFANWLHNGQPMGAQDLTTTEDGSYYLNGAMSNAELMAVVREEDATWVIPSEDEWYKAAYHYNDGVTDNYWDYPASTDAVPDNGDPGGDTGNSANFRDRDFAYTIGSPYWRSEAGFFSLSSSPYGVFDQGGNVWEWNEAPIVPYRGIRGSSFGYGDNWLHAASRSSYGTPATEDSYVGFRVAEVSESASADLNGDGDVDLFDFALFQVEFTGDLLDFASYHAQLTGPQ